MPSLMTINILVVDIPYREKKSRGKVTKFFASDEIFPQLSFSRPVFFPDFFHLTKSLFRFFLSRIIIIISHLFAKLIIAIFFDAL